MIFYSTCVDEAKICMGTPLCQSKHGVQGRIAGVSAARVARHYPRSPQSAQSASDGGRDTTDSADTRSCQGSRNMQ